MTADMSGTDSEPAQSVETVMVTSVADFVRDILERFPSDSPVWFRGQARATWRLEPSLIRRNALEHERSLRDDFERDAYPRLDRVNLGGGQPEEWDWLFLQQHYRVPTRLMDWTESPLIGAYFALDETDVSDDDGDAAVWALQPHILNAISHIRPRTAWNVPMCGRSEDLNAYTLEEIDRVKDRTLFPLAAVATRRFDRIIAQSGVFTVAHPSHPEPLEDIVPDGLIKYVLPVEAKAEMRQHVERLGVTASSVFPDLEHLGRHIGSRLPS